MRHLMILKKVHFEEYIICRCIYIYIERELWTIIYNITKQYIATSNLHHLGPWVLASTRYFLASSSVGAL